MTRLDTDGLLWLDIRRLRTQGALQPGAISSTHWTCRGEPSGDIMHVMAQDGATLTLHYRERRRGDPWRQVVEPIAIATTDQHFGGVRRWFVCPGCGDRRGVLWSAGGLFRCRVCHRLAYSSTREEPIDRAIRHRERIRARIGGTGRGMDWLPGDKPRGMRWATWARQMEQWRDAEDRFEEEFVVSVRQLARRVGVLEDRLD